MSVTGPGRRILVADDVVVNTMIAVRQLKTLGFEADVVHSGREAVDAVERLGYPLVLMDCHMPDMDGFQASEEIRRREGPVRRARIIAMTASARDVDRERCLAAGMDDYLAKPVNSEALRAMLDRWLDPAATP
jgi:CheY-like chemotaxis protein